MHTNRYTLSDMKPCQAEAVASSFVISDKIMFSWTACILKRGIQQLYCLSLRKPYMNQWVSGQTSQACNCYGRLQTLRICRTWKARTCLKYTCWSMKLRFSRQHLYPTQLTLRFLKLTCNFRMSDAVGFILLVGTCISFTKHVHWWHTKESGCHFISLT